jgi:4-hydroxy-tetrahydrodipicolinate synthase
MSTPFGRLLTAMITPFDAEGAVDHGVAWELAKHLVDTGSEGIVVGGTTGESPTLDDDEKVALFRAVVEAVGDRAVVVAGTGTYDTAHSIHLTERAVQAGVHGVMAVTPYYSRPSQQGLFEHFTAIADASSVPVLLYNIPSRTGRLIEVDTLARLSAHPRIVAVKDAVGDLAFTTKTRLACPDDFAIYSGDDILTVPIMAVGGVGIVSVAAHLAGEQIRSMVDAAAEGDWAEARRLHLGLAPLFAALFVEPNPMPVKAALDALWRPVGPPRLPLVPASADTVSMVKEALAAARAL